MGKNMEETGFHAKGLQKRGFCFFWGIMLYLAKLLWAPVHPHSKSHFNFCLKTPCDRSNAPSWKVLKVSRLCPACSQAVSWAFTFQGGLRVPIEPGQPKPDYCGHHPIWIQSGWQAAQGFSWPTWESVKAQNCFLIWLVWIFKPF